MMNYLDLAEKRKSIRDFRNKEVEKEKIQLLLGYFRSCRRLVPGIQVELMSFDSSSQEKLEGLAGYKGYIIGAPYYLVLLSEKGDHDLENAGYLSENLVLKLTDMGLDSCFITFGESGSVKAALSIDSGKEVVSIIAYGYGKPEKERRILNILSPSHVEAVKREGHLAPKIALKDFVYDQAWGQKAELSEAMVDDGLHNAFYGASLSPSFLNRQPHRMILDAGMVVLVRLEDQLTTGRDVRLNSGVVMFHFSAVLSDWRPTYPEWTMGQPPKAYQLPDGCQVVGYCRV